MRRLAFRRPGTKNYGVKGAAPAERMASWDRDGRVGKGPEAMMRVPQPEGLNNILTAEALLKTTQSSPSVVRCSSPWLHFVTFHLYLLFVISLLKISSATAAPFCCSQVQGEDKLFILPTLPCLHQKDLIFPRICLQSQHK